MITTFPTDGAWLRCSLHAHTNRSDGEPTPAGLVAHYAQAGYDVLAITDHWTITTLDDEAASPAIDDGLVLIPSVELSALTGDHVAHADVLAYGITEMPARREHLPSIAAAARWIVERGGVAYLPHPYWSGIESQHYLDAPDLSGIEVYNASSEVLEGCGLSDAYWDVVLARGGSCLALGTDDCHHPGNDSRLAWTMVRVAERSAAAVLEALRTGAFYATTGPRLDAIERQDDGGVIVRCSAAVAVTLRTGPREGSRANADPLLMSWQAQVLERDDAGLVRAARFDPLPDAAWARFEVLAANGDRAWSNPIALA